MRRGRKKRCTRHTVCCVRIGLLVSCVTALFMLLDARLRPVIITMAQYQCRVVSTLAMNEAVIEEMAASPNLSSKLLAIEKNADGMVTSIAVDSAALNDIKAHLTQAVAQRLFLLQKQDIGIPLGTLLGWQLLAGRGPDVRLQMIPASFVQATTESQLITAGINQTQHRIMVHFTVEMSAILPGYSTSVTVENDVCVAETLVVGKVPDFYAVR